MFTLFGAEDLETALSNLSLTVTLVGAALVVALLLLSVLLAKRKPAAKLPLFVAIVVIVAGTTLTISGSTVYLNLKSASGGPVHWHADFEIWACGNEMELRDPTGLSNKIGTPTLHEHNDKRIHLEGVPISLPYDFSLGKFMGVIGGGISDNALTVPLNNTGYFASGADKEDGDGPGAPDPDAVQPYIHTEADGKVATFVSGEKCGNQPAVVQVFAYHYNAADKTYSQQKIVRPANFAPTYQANVPPGDCIIMEFAPAKDKTDKLCKQYGVHDATRCGAFGVPEADRKTVCDSTQRTTRQQQCDEAAKTHSISLGCFKVERTR